MEKNNKRKIALIVGVGPTDFTLVYEFLQEVEIQRLF